jgi:superfamily II DNA or RNA helicase
VTAAASVPAWAHQLRGREFAHELWRKGRRGVLLDMAMGTGKTRLAIELIGDLNARFALIVCPKRVVEVWRAQFAQYAAGPWEFVTLDDRAGSVRDKMAQARDRYAWAQEREQRLAVCINYESARLDPFAAWAQKILWHVVVADECHRLQQSSGRTSKFMARLGLNARFRIGLTGTPMPHTPLDIWGPYRFLDRNILDPTYGSFKIRHAKMGGFFNKQIVGWRDLDQLNEKFRTIAFQVDSSVLNLPPAIDETLEADFTPAGERVYRQMERDMVAWIEDMDGQGVPVTAANAMVRLQRLQQITGGSLPDELLRPAAVDDAKERLLADFLEDVGQEPVVVFAVYKADLAAIHRAAAANALLSGEVSGSRDEFASWRRGAKDDPTVLAVQMQSGSEGIDMTRSRLTVYYSHGYSLRLYLQSRARILRPPQRRPCAFYHLQIRNSIDRHILRAVLSRQDFIEGVLKGLRKN